MKVDDNRRASYDPVGSSTPPSSNDPETLKKQYESKLKDVMEKAREHARKIAGERDEQKRLNDEKEGKLLQLKQQLQAVTLALETKTPEIRELHAEVERKSSAMTNLELQLAAMEQHYTQPEADVEGVASFEEWVLAKSKSTGQSRWWRKSVLPENMPVGATLDAEQMSRLTLELASVRKEFGEYKKKVELVLAERKEEPRLPENGIETARKLMKQDEALAAANTSISRLAKQVSELQLVEKGLEGRLASASCEVVKLKEQGVGLELKLGESQAESSRLSAALTAGAKEFEDLKTQLDLARAQSVATIPSSQTASTQTDEVVSDVVKPEPLLVRKVSPQASHTSPSQPSHTPHASPHAPTHTYLDQIAIPLRAQIRQLVSDVETEQQAHRLTQTQLSVVKGELRRVEAETRMAAHLADPLRMEYMRNVARRFAVLLPITDDSELEKLVPVVLSFFQIPAEETASLLAQRSGGSKKNFSLW